MRELLGGRLRLAAAALLLFGYAGLVAVNAVGQARFAAQQQLARSYLTEGQFEAAAAAATQLVSIDPAEAAHLGLLGSARLGSGDAANADEAFRASVALGWRDPATQLYWYAGALRRGDWRQAAARADAILRVRPHSDRMQVLVAPLEASGEGRAALAERLAARPRWLDRYLRSSDGLGPGGIVARAETVLKLDGALRCDEIQSLRIHLTRAERPVLARAVADRFCRPSR